MTVRLNRHRESISNYFDEILEGIGKRGSSFMDVDAVSHDKDTHRFIFQEFKEPGEALHPAQAMVLRDLAGLPRCEVWFVRRADGGRIGWARFGSLDHEELLTVEEYRERFRRWWKNEAVTPAPAQSIDQPMTADDIDWGDRNPQIAPRDKKSA